MVAEQECREGIVEIVDLQGRYEIADLIGLESILMKRHSTTRTSFTYLLTRVALLSWTSWLRLALLVFIIIPMKNIQGFNRSVRCRS